MKLVVGEITVFAVEGEETKDTVSCPVQSGRINDIDDFNATNQRVISESFWDLDDHQTRTKAAPVISMNSCSGHSLHKIFGTYNVWRGKIPWRLTPLEQWWGSHHSLLVYDVESSLYPTALLHPVAWVYALEFMWRMSKVVSSCFWKGGKAHYLRILFSTRLAWIALKNSNNSY